MRVAWFSPLPPMRSGISDYSYELLPLLAEAADVTVFCSRPGLIRGPKGPPGIPVLSPDRFDASRFDATFFHLANNPHHDFIYEASLRHPGICVFHDVSLHHLIAHRMVEAGKQPRRYEDVLVSEYGQVGARLAALKRRGAASDFEKFLFPLSGHVVRRAAGVVVHSLDSRQRLEATIEGDPLDVPIEVIPHHAGAAPPAVAGLSRAEARRRLRLPEAAFLVGHLGFLTLPKQPAALVSGFTRLYQERPDARLVMVGADHTGAGFARTIRRYGVEEAVRTTGFVDLPRFYLYLKALDVVVNLRYPTAGESSGTFARALSEGRAVVVNNYGSFAEVPDDVVLKVEIDEPQDEQLSGHLLRLAGDPEFQERLEANARSYATTVLDPVRCRDVYLAFAERVLGDERRRAEAARPRPGGRARPEVAWARVETAHRARRAELERVAGDTLAPDAIAQYGDLLYRLLLGRPAEEQALRGAHESIGQGGRTLRSLAKEIVDSREFREDALTESLLAQVRAEGRAFTLHDHDEPVGPETTERVVEIPWVLSRYRGERRVLDIGYANASGVYLAAMLSLGIPDLHGLDLASSPFTALKGVRADIRRMPYRDGVFDLVLCISTIEHIGLDNTRYGVRGKRREGGDVAALAELARVLAPEGRLLVTVPFGRYEEQDWFVQYDLTAWRALVSTAPLRPVEQEVFRLTEQGWVRALDPRSTEQLAYGDEAPAARAVLCATLVRRPP
jgi:glycosyltransferase involved in cell wall biosynthesis/SAM-dependent methyltransferase